MHYNFAQKKVDMDKLMYNKLKLSNKNYSFSDHIYK